MDVLISKYKLIEKIISYGSSSAESRQIASRLKKLLPKRIKTLRQSYLKKYPAGKATRQALLSEEYKKYIVEYLDLRENSDKNRVMWETYRMYYHAKKTRTYKF